MIIRSAKNRYLYAYHKSQWIQHDIKVYGGVHKLRLEYLSFFDHLPPSVYIFYGIMVCKKSIFLTTYPPPLVNVVCERPLREHSHMTSDIFWVFLTYLPLLVVIECHKIVIKALGAFHKLLLQEEGGRWSKN